MRILVRSASLLAILFFLSGCATSVLGAKEELAGTQSGYGYVATTMAHLVDPSQPEAHLGASPAVTIQFFEPGHTAWPAFTVDTKANLVAWGLWYQQGVAMPEAKGKRVLSLVRVPVGQYQLGKLSATFQPGNRSAFFVPKDFPTIEVRSGEVVYVGSMHLLTQYGKNLFGHTQPYRATLLIKNEAETDIAAMRKIDPRLTDAKIVNGLQGRAEITE